MSSVNAPESRIALPRPPGPPPAHPFPWLATIAPVVVSVAIWAATQSPFALLFALLGPLIAVSSLIDSRVHDRRRRRIELRRFFAAASEAEAAIERGHARTRERLSHEAPSATLLAGREGHDPDRWRRDFDGPIPVNLGRAERPGGLVLDALPSEAELPADVDERLAALRRSADRAPDVPVLVDARLGIGVVGPPVLAAPVARAVLAQLAHALSPAQAVLIGPPGDPGDEGLDYPWWRRLPHHAGPARHVSRETESRECAEFALFDTATGEPRRLVIAVAGARAELPNECRVVVSVGGREAGGALAAVVAHPDPDQLGPLDPELLSARQALGLAGELAAAAQREGFQAAANLPERVEFARLPAPKPAAGSLAVPIGIGQDGAPVGVDLVRQGPHALVAGTTGSGKSELLVSWVLAMARARAPRDLGFLLVDFKGGSAFDPLAGLPHVLGVITDLDEEGAERALRSLAAELRHRERELARRRLRSIDEASDGELARLVIVVDEYAALNAGFPQLAELFSDIAARGRSLGVHLVLCTQRPGGVVREAVLANTGLRLSLRVNNRADSTAVVGSDLAFHLPAGASGRAVLAAPEGPVTVQLALATADDVALVAAAHPPVPGEMPVRRPWLDPLPAVLPLTRIEEAAEPGAYPIGMLDLPDEQRHVVAAYRPAEHGNLLVVGARRSGKSTLLTALTRFGCVRVPDGVEAVWDAVHAALAGEGADDPLATHVLMIDDIDNVLARLDDEYQRAFLDALARLAREGPGNGRYLVLSAQQLANGLQTTAALFDSRILLRLPGRNEFLLAGGEPQHFTAALPPGGGVWQGARLQLAWPGPGHPSDRRERLPAPAASDVEPPYRPRPGVPCLVVSSAPAAVAERLDAAGSHEVVVLGAGSRDPRDLSVSAGSRPALIVADPDSWQSWWGALAALRGAGDVLVEGCTPAEFRVVTRSRSLPPPVEPGRRAAWLLDASGSVRRVRLPSR